MHLLQETLFPAAGRPEELYLRINGPSGQRAINRVGTARGTAQNQGTIELEAGETLSTNTFFGSFYRAYWQKFAPLGQLAVKLEFRGAGRLRIHEATRRGVVLLSEHALENRAGPTVIEFHPGDSGTAIDKETVPTSRIFVEIEARRDCSLRSIDFVSPDTAPRRDVRLSIGLCTFNQEQYLARTLAGIARLARQEPKLGTVHVVNQGAPFESGRINTLLRAPLFHLVEQRNLGGCGGFTRSLMEEQQAVHPATHHLMMDDDIVLDARLIRRAIRFLSFTTGDIALGGAMFDELYPQVMYEAGACLTSDNRVEAYCQNVDLADSTEQGRFDNVVETDYNAWWFCILPLERTREIGLPAPIFIRGDDFEYGQRLAQAGVPTVTLPGVAVWHEPFYAKPDGWQAYYDLRNRLVFGATYGAKVRQLSLVSVLGLLIRPCLIHNYMLAELRLKAVTDFLKGPDQLFAQDPEDLHGEVMALARANAPEKLDDAAWKDRPLTPDLPRRPEGMRAMVLGTLASCLGTGLLPRRRGRDPVMLADSVHPGTTMRRAYVMTNQPRSYHQRFVPDRLRLWALMLRVAALALGYRRKAGTASVAWVDGIGKFQQPQSWARLLDKPERTESPPCTPASESGAIPDRTSPSRCH